MSDSEWFLRVYFNKNREYYILSLLNIFNNMTEKKLMRIKRMVYNDAPILFDQEHPFTVITTSYTCSDFERNKYKIIARLDLMWNDNNICKIVKRIYDNIS